MGVRGKLEEEGEGEGRGREGGGKGGVKRGRKATGGSGRGGWSLWEEERMGIRGKGRWEG